jgi:hypothetical protein
MALTLVVATSAYESKGTPLSVRLFLSHPRPQRQWVWRPPHGNTINHLLSEHTMQVYRNSFTALLFPSSQQCSLLTQSHQTYYFILDIEYCDKSSDSSEVL